MNFHINRKIKRFAQVFDAHGYQCLLVGGALRNMAAGKEVIDYDFASDAKPEEVIALFKRVIPTGLQHGTVTVLFEGENFEVTTFRLDGKYSDSRHPDSISYTSDLLEDLSRRDFTVNAMALEIISGHFHDPHHGLADLKKGIIRAIGDPEKRFKEDALRMLRALRFAAAGQWQIEKATFEAIKKLNSRIKEVSKERCRDELIKMLQVDLPSSGFLMLEDCSLLQHLIPELREGIAVQQKGDHQFDVFHHLIYSCDAADKESLELRLAALFHDVGKPRVLAIAENGLPTFYQHEKVSAQIVQKRLKELRFPGKLIRTVAHLVEHHMFNYTQDWSDKAIRRFISRVGIEQIEELFALREADVYGMQGKKHQGQQKITELKERISQVLEEGSSFQIKDLLVNGKDLAAIGIPKGPEMGIVLNELLDAVLDDPSQNEKNKLLLIARQFYEKRMNL